MKLSSVTGLIVSLATTSVWAGAGITYHGRLLKSDQRPVTSNAVEFRISVKSPGNENCLMYRENHVADLSASEGVFAITINDGTETVANGEPFSLDRVFQNRGTFNFAAGKCAIGNTYSPNVADGRKLVVEFNDGSFTGWEPLPAQAVNFVPMALETLTVGGYGSGSMLRVNDVSGEPAIVSALTQTQFAALLDVVNGTSTQYLTPSSTVDAAKITDATITDSKIASGISGSKISGNISGNAAGFTGSLAGDVSGTQSATSVVKIRGRDVDSAAPSDGQVLKWSQSNSRWEPGTAGLSSVAISDVTGLTTALGNKIDQSQMPAACASSQTLSFISVTGAWSCTTIANLNASAITAGVLPVAYGGTGSGNGSITGTSALALAAGGTNQNVTITPSGTGFTLLAGNVGVGTTTPAAKIDVQGEVRLGNSGLACGSTTEGALRYNSSTKRMEFCNGTAWSQISAGTVASVTLGSPSSGLVKSGPVTVTVTYGSATDSGTINLTSGDISFSGTDFSGCAVTGIAVTSAFVRTVTLNNCTGTGTVAMSVRSGTAASTTGDPAAAAGPSTTYNVDNAGPTVPGSLTLGATPSSLSSTPTISYSASTDVGGSSVASYQVQITKVSDGSVVSAWATHTSGTAINGLSLSPSTQYAASVRALDALGNIGSASSTQTWTTIAGFPFNVTISSNATNYNLRAAAVTAGWDQVIPLIANITINSGVAVYGTAPSTPAFITGSLTASSTITITNNGSLLGGAYSSGYTDKTTNQAWEGGTALQIDWPTTIVNNGQIIGGSGGGGAAEGDSCYPCGGGNGASAGGAGGAAVVFNANATITGSGAIYGAGGGGAGGGGAYAAGVGSGYGGDGQGAYGGTTQNAVAGQTTGICGGGYGGDGGTYGQPGLAGGNCGNGGANGGAGGYAMILNGKSVTYNSVTVVGNSSYTEATWIANTKGRIAP